MLIKKNPKLFIHICYICLHKASLKKHYVLSSLKGSESFLVISDYW